MRINKLSLILLLAWTPTALAASLTAVAGAALDTSGIISMPVGIGATIGGTCTTTNPTLITPVNLGNMTNTLNNAFQKVGQFLAETQAKQMQAQVTQMNQQLQEQILFQEELNAKDASQAYLNDTTGMASINPCFLASGAQSTLAGLTKANAYKDFYNKDAQVRQNPVANPNDVTHYLANASKPDYDADTLISASGAPSSPNSVSAYISNLVTPVRARALPSSATVTPAGKAATAFQNMTTARQSLPTEALSYVATQESPMIDAAYADQQWSAFNGGAAPGTVNGKISPNGLLEVLTNSRYASQQFYKQVQADPSEAWQIKQYAMMLAVQLRISQVRLNLLERTAALQAASLAAEQDNSSQAESLRGTALSQAVQ